MMQQYTFPYFLKQIRKTAGLTQVDLAKALDVSAVLIAMIETGQKPASKKLILSLARLLEIHPGALFPFFFDNEVAPFTKMSNVEKLLLKTGFELQNQLIREKSKHLMNYAAAKKVS